MTRTTRTTRRATLTVLGALTAGLLTAPALPPAPARAAAATTTLTVVGPSELLDSHVWQEAIKPRFEETVSGRDLTLDYVGLDTAEAVVDYAESGQADVMILDSPADEARFVADGYSAEAYGRSVFWSDDVLLGSKDDPAGVRTNAPHDVVTALERIAAVGAAGRAEFVSRGGTSDRTTEEHALWARTDGVTTCTVSQADGGGESPSTVSGPCPTPIPLPSWYHATGTAQGPTVQAAEACDGYASAACYTLSDRGTHDYLASGFSPEVVSDLRVLTSGNDAAGGVDLLVNPFHVYTVDAGVAPGVDTEGARQLVQWLTYDPVLRFVPEEVYGQAFRLANAPVTTYAPIAHSVGYGGAVEARGSLTSPFPGGGALGGVPVSIVGSFCGDDSCSYTSDFVVGTTTTDASGAFRFRFTPRYSAGYGVTTGDVSRLRDPDLGFGETFRETASDNALGLGRISVLARFGTTRITTGSRSRFEVSARLAPGGRSRAVVRMYAARPGDMLRYRASVAVADGQSSVRRTFRLAPGRWTIQLVYVPVQYYGDGDVLPARLTRSVVLR